MKSDSKRTARTPPTASPTPAKRTSSWHNIVALEGDAAAVVAENRPLPDSARGLVDVAQKAKRVSRTE